MLISVLLFILGLICLIKGGDWFVEGSTGIARKFRLPELLIGATIVSIGTTLPEVMVSTTSALTGHGEIAYGNAIGSIICNTALIAAITITVKPTSIKKWTLQIPVFFFFFSAVFYAGVAYFKGYFSRAVGLTLLFVFALHMTLAIMQMKNKPLGETYKEVKVNEKKKKSGEEDNDEGERSLKSNICLLVIGAVLIAVGANLLVENGTLIAQVLGVPESVIALTFVALGTSLPELVTAITSLLKGHGSLSLGNIIGANLFNLVLVSGVSVTLAPFSVPKNAILFGHNASLVLDIPVMFAVMLVLAVPALIHEKLFRAQGIILLLIYAVFCLIQFTL